MHVPALIVVAGPPGSGKTTFAQRVAEELGATHLESDAVRRELFDDPTHEAAESATVFRVMEARTSEALERGATVIVDATNLRKDGRRRFARLATRYSSRLVAVRVTAPEATIRERLAAPREGSSDADVTVFERMRGSEQLIGGPHVVVDTRFDLAPSVTLVRRLAEGA